jgi:hypothetical protein
LGFADGTVRDRTDTSKNIERVVKMRLALARLNWKWELLPGELWRQVQSLTAHLSDLACVPWVVTQVRRCLIGRLRCTKVQTKNIDISQFRA